MNDTSYKGNVIPIKDWENKVGFPVDGGGGPPHITVMEQRVLKLEDKMDKVQDTLSDIRVTLARMDERISHLPTYKGIGVLMSSIIASAAALVSALHYFHIL